MRLRHYQSKAIEDTESAWKQNRSLVGVMATGGGKTNVACELIQRNRPGRALFLAHRTELIQQAAARLKSFGIECDIEQGDKFANGLLWDKTPVLLATPQTLFAGKDARLKRFKPLDFSLMIVDECHHFSGAVAYERVVKYFKDGNPALRLLGLTATPDRTDQIALARVFDGIAFDVEIVDLIDDGYLVPIKQHMVKIESLDFSKCRVTAGDLNGADLASVMEFEKSLIGVADAIVKTVGDRRTIVFAATVKTAERYAEILNRYKANSADCVFGHTPEEKRTEAFRRYRAGEFQFLVNVGVVTEGVDVPEIAAVAMCRPTLSRSLYCQCIGRGSRPIPGLVDSLDAPEERRSAIAASAKPNVMVLDFCGNAGRHSLITSADILGGKMSTEAQAKAKREIEKKGGGDMLDELRKAEAELRERADAARRSKVVADASFTMHYVDPFDGFRKEAQKWQNYRQRGPLTEAQRNILRKNGHDPEGMPVEQGKEIIDAIFRMSDKQRSQLIRMGYKPEELDGLKKWQASKLIGDCVANNWKRPAKAA